MVLNLGKEPVAILGIASAALNAIQIAAIAMPTWLHTVVAVLLIVVAAVLSRAEVTPVTKQVANVPPPPPAAPAQTPPAV